MLQNLISQLLTAIVQIVVLVVSGFLLNYINKAKVALEEKRGKEKFHEYLTVVRTAVYAVEQQFPDLSGCDKYLKAIELINKKLGKILTEDELRLLIEAAVGKMNSLKNKSQATLKDHNS